jgi:adenylyltransferase/sulfurtransferase
MSIYLAAAGVGRIGIVDFDIVEFSNLQRQILHYTSDVGRPKLESAFKKLKDINPEIEVVAHEGLLTSENALEICEDYDVVADGTDNFPTRYLVNDACVLLGKPNVYASIFRFEGRASVFYAEKGPCYRCLHPEPPPPGMVPSCAEGGVLGILPGIMGSIQAAEVIKLILGIGEPLIGRLLLFDALEMSMNEMRLERDPNCPICGENPTIHELIDYEQFCGIPVGSEGSQIEALGAEWEITPMELQFRLESNSSDPLILDVRDPHEWDICHLPKAHLIPESDLPERMHELDSSNDIIVYCRTGIRSVRALKLLREAGFSKLKNLKGGIHRWADDVDPSIPKY